jgi:prepilin-type N-terminal cleavage/methylation domain-containing protein
MIPSAKHRLGFSLVELLVVLAIVSILAALLFPALSQARARGQWTRCTGNLRTFGIAVNLYWQENQDRCFSYRTASIDGGDVYWFGWLERGAEGNRAFDRTQGALHAYLPGEGVDLCPSLKYSMESFKLKARGAAYGYGYNLLLSAAPNRPSFRMPETMRPSGLVVFADAGQINTFQSPASPLNPMLEEFYYVSTNTAEATAHFRHQRLANCAAADGSVVLQRPAPASLDSRLPTVTVGRLPPAILIPLQSDQAE